MPTAAILSVALLSILPIIAISVIDKIGSAIPAIKAGIASLLMFLKLISAFKKSSFCKGTYLKNVKRRDSFKIN